MEFNAVTKEVVKSDSWSSLVKFTGTFSESQIPCTGEYREFHGNSSVVTEGERWLRRVTFTPDGCDEQVTAYFWYTDNIWGSGYWRFEEGPDNRTLWAARKIFNQDEPMFEAEAEKQAQERKRRWYEETRKWVAENYKNGERIWNARAYSKWLREPNVKQTIEDIVGMGYVPSEDKTWRQCADCLGFGPKECGLSVPRFEYAVGIARLIA